MTPLPGSHAAEMRQQQLREARLELPVVTATVVMANRDRETVQPYLRHEVSDNGALMVFTRDDDGDEWPDLTVAPGYWGSVIVTKPEIDQ